jgi:hypothetical protein
MDSTSCTVNIFIFVENCTYFESESYIKLMHVSKMKLDLKYVIDYILTYVCTYILCQCIKVFQYLCLQCC